MKRTVLTGLVAMGALVAVALAATQLGGGSSQDGGGAPDGDKEIAVRLQGGLAPDTVPGVEAGGAAGETFAASGGFGGGEVAPPLPDVVGRKIVRNATVSLGVEDVLAAVRQVRMIATGAGGFVSNSSVFLEDTPEPLDADSAAPTRTQSATVTIRVPAATYESTMDQLKGIDGELQSESSTTSDVTEEFADLEARLRNQEATEARYLELLGRAESIPDILTLQDRLSAVRLEIERLQGRMNLLNDLTDLATIGVQLRPMLVIEEPSEPGWAQEVWEDAWDTSQEALQGLGTAAIVAGVVLAWLAVPALALGIAWRLFGPRRESKGQA